MKITIDAFDKKLRRHLLWSCVIAAFGCGLALWEAVHTNWKPVIVGAGAGGLIVIADWARADYARFRRQKIKADEQANVS